LAAVAAAAAGQGGVGDFGTEFSDRDGRTYESLGLRPDQIMVLHYEPVNGNSENEMAPV
jgi:hypothetical protein